MAGPDKGDRLARRLMAEIIKSHDRGSADFPAVMTALAAVAAQMIARLVEPASRADALAMLTASVGRFIDTIEKEPVQ